MNILQFNPNRKNYKILNKVLSSDFCKDAKVDVSIIEKIKITFIFFKKRNEILGICGLYVSKYKTNELFIAVEKKYRNKGIGKKLMKKLIGFCEKKKIYFFIQTINNKTYLPALNLYKSLGYNKCFCIDNKIILMKKNYPFLIVFYRIIFFYYSSLKFLIKKKFIK